MKRLAHVIFLAVSLCASCAKEINSPLSVNDPQAEAFMRGQHLGGHQSQSYFIKRMVRHPDGRVTEVVRKYSELNLHYIGTGNWEAVHPPFSQAIIAWLHDEAKRQDPGILAGIELTAYIFLNNYLFKAEATPALAEATAFYLKTLIELGGSAEWGILARALKVSREALPADEYKTIARYLRKSAADILKNGAEKSLSDEQQARQVEAARQAVAWLEND